MDKDLYANPLIERYAGPEMSSIFSDANRFRTWRSCWIALAEAEAELGLSISDQQLDELLGTQLMRRWGYENLDGPRTRARAGGQAEEAGGSAAELERQAEGPWRPTVEAKPMCAGSVVPAGE